MDSRWQLQEAKQRFSEVVRRAETDGAQFVTRHGSDVVVVLDVAEFRRLHSADPDFKQYLRSAPAGDGLEISRAVDQPREVDLQA